MAAYAQEGSILIADDDILLCRGLERVLSQSGLDVQYVTDSREVLTHARSWDPDVVLLDVVMPFQNGIETLRTLKEANVRSEAVMMTAQVHGDVVVEAMRAGAYHFLNKPLEHETLRLTLSKAIQLRRLRDRSTPPPSFLKRTGIVGESRAIHAVRQTIERVAEASSTVLILGESGTGKELVARAIHAASPMAAKRLITVNCAAIPHDLIESELFGHVRGAFTGAHKDRAGLFESAAGGTIFLDEIGELPLAAQAKLLRVLQERELKRVGSDETVKVDVRVIAATNVDLAGRVVKNEFRRDLYYRLNVIALEVPPLRERSEDIPLLVHHFLEKLSERMARARPALDESTLDALVSYPWPGNVRELEHVIERAFVLCQTGVIEPEDLSIVAKTTRVSRAQVTKYADAKRAAQIQFEREYVLTLLEAVGGNVSKAARLAGIDRTNLRRLMRRANVTARGLQKERT